MNRDRLYYRHHRVRSINRKLRIMSYWLGKDDAEYLFGPGTRQRGRLAKGKVHCSCWRCRDRTKIEAPIRDKRKAQFFDDNDNTE